MNLNQLYVLFQGLTTLYILYLVFPLSSINIYSPFSPEPKFPSPSPPVYPTTYARHDSVVDDADIWLDFNRAQMKPETGTHESVIDPGFLGVGTTTVSRVFPLFGGRRGAALPYNDFYKLSQRPSDADSEVELEDLSNSVVFTIIATFFGLVTGAAILVVTRRGRERHDTLTTLASREHLSPAHYQIHALAETSVDFTQSNIPWIFGRSDSESSQVVSKFATPSPLAAVPCEAYSSPSKKAALLSQRSTTPTPLSQAGLINSSLLSVVDSTFDSVDFQGTSSDTLVTDLSPQRPMHKGTFARAVSSTHEDASENLNVHLTDMVPVTYSQDQDMLFPVHEIGMNGQTFDIERHLSRISESQSDSEEEATKHSFAAAPTKQHSDHCNRTLSNGQSNPAVYPQNQDVHEIGTNEDTFDIEKHLPPISELSDCEERTFPNSPSNPVTYLQDHEVHEEGTNEDTFDIEKHLPPISELYSDSEEEATRPFVTATPIEQLADVCDPKETLSNGPSNQDADSLAIFCKAEIVAEAQEFQMANSITNLADPPLKNPSNRACAAGTRHNKVLADTEILFFNPEEIQASSPLAKIADPSSESLPWLQSESQGNSRKELLVALTPFIQQECAIGKSAKEFLAGSEPEDLVFDPQEFQASSSFADIADTSLEFLPWIQPESKGKFPEGLPAGPSIFVFEPDEFRASSALGGIAELADTSPHTSPLIQQECAPGKDVTKSFAASKPEDLVFDPQEFQASSSLANIADTSSESLPWLQPELKPKILENTAGPSNFTFDTDEFQAISSLIGMAELADTSSDPSPLIQQGCAPGKGAAEFFAALEPEDLAFDPQEFQASSPLADITDTSSESLPWLQPESKRKGSGDHRASLPNLVFDPDEFQVTCSLVGMAELPDPSPPIQQECAPEKVSGKFCAASEDLVFDPEEFQASSSLADFADSSSDSLPWLLPESNEKVIEKVYVDRLVSSPSLKFDAQEFHVVTSLVGIPELEHSSPGSSPLFEQKPAHEKDFEKFLAGPELIFDPGEFQASSSLVDIADSSSESLPWFQREYEAGKVPKDVYADPFLTSSNPIFDPDEFQATSSLVNLADLATSPPNPVRGRSNRRKSTVRSTSRSEKSSEEFLFNPTASIRTPPKLDLARTGSNNVRQHAGPPNFPLEGAFNPNEILTIKRLVNHTKLSASNSNPSLTRGHEHSGITLADVSNAYDMQDSPTPKERSKTLRRSHSLGSERRPRDDYNLSIALDSDITHHRFDDKPDNQSQTRHPQQPHIISPVRERPIALEQRKSIASAPASPRDPAFWRKFRRVTSFKAQPLGELLHTRK